MTTFAPKPQSNYTPAPAGTHVARCVQLINIGTIDGEYEGKPIRSYKVRIAWELPNETKVFDEAKGPQPILVNQEFTLSLGAKAGLRKIVEGMIGTVLKDEEAYSFDVEKIVGMPCLLTIIHKNSSKGKVYDKIASASPLVKGMTVPNQVNASKILSFNDFDYKLFDTLPTFLKDKISSSEEYQTMFENQGKDLSSLPALPQGQPGFTPSNDFSDFAEFIEGEEEVTPVEELEASEATEDLPSEVPYPKG